MAVNTTTQVTMPAMGESVTQGVVLEWHKQEGDTIAVDETLVEISTDKVHAEVPSPIAGTIVKIHAAEGDTVEVGSVLAEIAAEREGSAPAGAQDGEAAEAAGSDGASNGQAGQGQVIDIVTPTAGE